MGMKSKDACEILKILVGKCRVDFVALQEPFLVANQVEEFRIILGFDFANVNSNKKIWYFWRSTLNCTVINSSRQQISFEVDDGEMKRWITVVYARTTVVKRRRLWKRLSEIHEEVNGPWAILGDFNSIMVAEEKKGGIPHTLSKSIEFI